MYLFFDTETTGLPKRYDAPASALNNWPRVIQLAWMLCDDAGREIECADYIIKPEGFLIPKDVARIHGITHERAVMEGVPAMNALLKFLDALGKSEVLVAHNMSFDQPIIEAEFLRNNIEYDLMRPKKICTKNASTNYCKIPGNYGFKWPSLMELHNKLFGSDFEDAHNALSDVKVCAKCFFELKRLGVL